jgi:hypothetical protein
MELDGVENGWLRLQICGGSTDVHSHINIHMNIVKS